jgi:triacylglycerol lipase
MSPPRHRVYLIPGMFGFARLAGFEYFGHLERALAERFRDAGVPLTIRGVPSLPTASIRRRARIVARAIASDHQESAVEEPVHLIGHSTGGLDARLLAMPTADLKLAPSQLAWRSQLRNIITVNAPHYGTPLARFFSTVSGHRLLYALSLVSVTTLSLGSAPLSLVANLAAGLGSVKLASSFEIRTLDRLTEAITRRLSAEEREIFHTFMQGVRYDQGGILQLMPETMDLFNAAVLDNPDLRYGCVVSASPAPTTIKAFRSVRSPYAALTATIYTTLHSITSGSDRRYPYASESGDIESAIAAGIGRRMTARDSDGVVPTLSMIWGDLLWAGPGDHLDVVGHFRDDQRPAVHSDWMTTGAQFNRKRFGAMVDALATRLLSA